MRAGRASFSEIADPLTGVRTLRIDRADKFIDITEEALAVLTERGWAGEGLFRIDGVNGSVTYALREQDPLSGWWRAERRTPWTPENYATSGDPS